MENIAAAITLCCSMVNERDDIILPQYSDWYLTDPAKTNHQVHRNKKDSLICVAWAKNAERRRNAWIELAKVEDVVVNYENETSFFRDFKSRLGFFSSTFIDLVHSEKRKRKKL